MMAYYMKARTNAYQSVSSSLLLDNREINHEAILKLKCSETTSSFRTF